MTRPSLEEQDLILRLLTTLLREKILIEDGGASFPAPDLPPAAHHPAPHLYPSPTPLTTTRASSHPTSSARWCGWVAYRGLRVPVRRGVVGEDLLAELAPRAAFVVVVRAGRRRVGRRLVSVVNLIQGELRDPELVAGFGELRAEALAALAAARVRRRARPRVLGEVRSRAWSGWAGHVELETLAAHRDHPLYPTSVAKAGLTAAQVTAWAPEHRPTLELHWYRIEEAEGEGDLPNFWPAHDAVPLHPGTTPPPGATRIDAPSTRVRPGLSLRTVVTADDPAVHLKLPMPLRTLGRLNLRGLTRAGLADGALLTRVLTAVRAADPELAPLGVADETTWRHAGPMLAVLVRRWAPVAPGSLVFPVAALPALPTAITGTDEFVERYLRVLLGVHVGLWMRHGIVLEAHPQNVLLVVNPSGDLQVLVRDLDSARIDPHVLRGTLGARSPTPEAFADPRLRSTSAEDLADLFVTTTLHQCVAATLIDLAARVRRPAGPWLKLARAVLSDLAHRHPEARDTPVLVERILDAPRLPVKRHLTAATLLPKTRTAAVDVNKFYGADAPSYL